MAHALDSTASAGYYWTTKEIEADYTTHNPGDAVMATTTKTANQGKTAFIKEVLFDNLRVWELK